MHDLIDVFVVIVSSATCLSSFEGQGQLGCGVFLKGGFATIHFILPLHLHYSLIAPTTSVSSFLINSPYFPLNPNNLLNPRFILVTLSNKHVH